jgi:hypothetical protein
MRSSRRCQALTLIELPTTPYLGLDRQEGEARAQGENRFLRELTSLRGPRRTDLRLGRVNVVFGLDGKVVAADAG